MEKATGRCAVCDRHYRLTTDGRPVSHQFDGKMCDGCDVTALPRSRAVTKRDLEGNKQRVYEAVKNYMGINRIAPSVRDVVAATGLSESAVFYHLRRLEQDGKIELRQKISRGILLKESA